MPLAPARRPNILLITTDQQRYDTLGCNGNTLIQTPHLDALAAQGARFENAFCNNPVCIPSRACLQTGRYTHQHGVRYMEDRVNDTPGLPWWEETFMEHLQGAGYATGGFGKVHMFPPRGFDRAQLTNGQGQRWEKPYGSALGPAQLGDDYACWLENKRPGAYEQLYEQRRSAEYKQYRTAVTGVLEFDETVDYWAAQNTIDFIKQERDRPFFAWLGFCNPHGPLDTPRDYANLYDPAAIELSAKYLKRPNPADLPEDVMRRWIAHYYGLCTMLDDLSQMAFDALKATGQWDDTLIIYTSDHGELMGDLGRFGKGNFSEAVINVPLLIKAPHSRTAQTVTDLTELIDLAPTMLDYADLPLRPTIQGRSLRPRLDREDSDGEAWPKQQILCEYVSNDRRVQAKCLRTARYKYALWTPDYREELYDLHHDPQEWHNLASAPEHTGLLAQMRQRLLGHLMESENPILKR